jgi:hypothetical protein
MPPTNKGVVMRRLNATNIKDYIGKKIKLETTIAGNTIQCETGSWIIPIDAFRKSVTLIAITESLPGGQATKVKILIDGKEAIVRLNHFSGVFGE